MEHKISSLTKEDYTLRCVRCYKSTSLRAIPHKAQNKILNGIVGMVFACKKCSEKVYSGIVHIDFLNNDAKE